IQPSGGAVLFVVGVDLEEEPGQGVGRLVGDLPEGCSLSEQLILRLASVSLPGQVTIRKYQADLSVDELGSVGRDEFRAVGIISDGLCEDRQAIDARPYLRRQIADKA